MSAVVHHAAYAIDAALMNRARAHELTLAELLQLTPVATYESDGEHIDPEVQHRAFLALPPETEHVCCRTWGDGKDTWSFHTFGDPGFPILFTNCDTDENLREELRRNWRKDVGPK
jgi:hypothetical protein